VADGEIALFDAVPLAEVAKALCTADLHERVAS
jgi:hypothetical protein